MPLRCSVRHLPYSKLGRAATTILRAGKKSKVVETSNQLSPQERATEETNCGRQAPYIYHIYGIKGRLEGGSIHDHVSAKIADYIVTLRLTDVDGIAREPRSRWMVFRSIYFQRL
jgi:hypothetical protein